MKYILPLLAASSIFLLSCSAAAKKGYTDIAGNYKITFKGEPDTSSQTVSFPFGDFELKKAHIELLKDANLSYSAGYLDLPKNIITSDSLRLLQELFAITQNDLLSSLGPTALTAMTYHTVNGYPGRQYIWFDKDRKTGITRRMFIVKNRLYLLEVTYATAGQYNIDMKRFFDSFKLLKAGKNPHPEEIPEKPEKRYTAAFPGPTVSQDRQAFGTFGPQIITIEMCEIKNAAHLDESGNAGYSVLRTCFPKDKMQEITPEMKRDYIAANFRNNGIIVNGGEILSVTETTVEGQPAHEGIAVIINGQLVMHCRTFFVDNYMYQVTVMSQRGREENKAAKAFLDSFRLTH